MRGFCFVYRMIYFLHLNAKAGNTVPFSVLPTSNPYITSTNQSPLPDTNFVHNILPGNSIYIPIVPLHFQTH